MAVCVLRAELEALDADLASLVRSEGRLRLELGQALETLANQQGPLELGFSSLGGYVQQRCQRSLRWAESARALARRLEGQPVLRAALCCGAVSWSKAEVLAPSVTPENEARWVHLACRTSLRALSAAVKDERHRATLGDEAGSAGCAATVSPHASADADGGARGGITRASSAACGSLPNPVGNVNPIGTGHPGGTITSTGAANPVNGAGVAAGLKASDGENPLGEPEISPGDELCTLTLTLNQEEAWLFEATRPLVLGVGGPCSGWAVSPIDAVLKALVAEGESSFCGCLVAGGEDAIEEEGRAASIYRMLRAQWQLEGEIACEPGLLPIWEKAAAEAAAGMSAAQAGHARTTRGESRDAGNPPKGQAIVEAAGQVLVAAGQAPGTAGQSSVKTAGVEAAGQGTMKAAPTPVGEAPAETEHTPAGQGFGASQFETLLLEEVDAEVLRLSSELASLDLRSGQLALRFHRADGWRRLGCGSETQYARERLGLSRTTLKGRCALAAQLERLPTLAAALARSLLGVEAARLLARVASPASEAAWVERARRRTVKQLREEVDAAGVVLRLSGRDDCWPPSDEELADYFAVESTVLGGQSCLAQGEAAAPSTVDPVSSASAADPMSAGDPAPALAPAPAAAAVDPPSAADPISAGDPAPAAGAGAGAAGETGACAEGAPRPGSTGVPIAEESCSGACGGVVSPPIGQSHWGHALGALLAWLGRVGAPVHSQADHEEARPVHSQADHEEARPAHAEADLEGARPVHSQAGHEGAGSGSDGSPCTKARPASWPGSVRISAGAVPDQSTLPEAASPSVASTTRPGSVRISAGGSAGGPNLPGSPSAPPPSLPASPSLPPSRRRAKGRVRYRLRVSREVYDRYRSLERRLPQGMRPGHSLLAVLCQNFWNVWRHVVGAKGAYGVVYVRDRFHCTCPVCNRRDVTPHHVTYRSAGGGDEDENVTSACSVCHLEGVHRDRIRVTGRAPHLRWELVRARLVVQDREVLAA